MADEKLIIRLELDSDDANIRREINEVGNKAQRQARTVGQKISQGIQQGISGVSLGGLTTAFGAAALAATGLTLATGRFISAAAEQEDAVNALNSSLQRIGEFTQRTSQDLQDFASSLQESSRFGDEAILRQLAFAQSLGASAEQSKEVLAASADLATALNIDLNAATRNVARTLGGFAGELGEVIPRLRSLSQEQLRAGEGIRLLREEFRGLAQRDVQTTSGQLDQLRNTFGDLVEAAGRLITRSSSTSGAIKAIGEAASGAKAFLDDFAVSLSQSNSSEIEQRIRQLRVQIIDNEQAIIKATKATNFFSRALAPGAIRGFRKANEELNAELAELEARLTKVTTQEKEQEETKNRLAQAAKRQADAEKERAEALRAVGDIGLSQEQLAEERLARDLDALVRAEETKAITEEEFNQRALEREQQFQDQIDAIRGQNGDSTVAAFGIDLNFVEQLETADAAVQKFGTNFAKVAQATANAAVQGFGRGVGAGFTAFGRAIATGQNALDAFGKSLLATFGQTLSQLGQGFILQGIAQSIAGFGSGAPLIAAGVALSVFGGFLSGLGGGGEAPAPGAGSVGSDLGGFDGGFVDQPVAQDEVQEQGPSIQVNVQGDVLDSEETGTRIVQLINDAFDREGAVVTGGQFA